MDIRIFKLIDAFQTKGWILKGSVETTSDWWFSDILQLNSVWSPTDKVVYLTLLKDPYYLDKKIIWSIGISSRIPDNHHYKFLDKVAINDIKRINLSIFVTNINKLVLVNT